MYKLRFSIAIIIIIGFFTYLVIYQSSTEKKILKAELKIELKGVIEEIYYGEKGSPSVLINGKIYNLPDEAGELKIGDSIVKEKNDVNYYQYRNNQNIQSF